MLLHARNFRQVLHYYTRCLAFTMNRKLYQEIRAQQYGLIGGNALKFDFSGEGLPK